MKDEINENKLRDIHFFPYYDNDKGDIVFMSSLYGIDVVVKIRESHINKGRFYVDVDSSRLFATNSFKKIKNFVDLLGFNVL